MRDGLRGKPFALRARERYAATGGRGLALHADEPLTGFLLPAWERIRLQEQG